MFVEGHNYAVCCKRKDRKLGSHMLNLKKRMIKAVKQKHLPQMLYPTAVGYRYQVQSILKWYML